MNVRFGLVIGALLLLSGIAPAAIIADHPADFASPPTAGWAYYTGTAGNSATYVPLVWNTTTDGTFTVNSFAPSATGMWGSADWGGSYTIVSGMRDGGKYYIHPGKPGTAVILAYTVQPGEAGVGTIFGTLAGFNAASDGWDVSVYVGNVLKNAVSLSWSSLEQNILGSGTGALGDLVAGDTVYVAIDARLTDTGDTASINFKINSEAAITETPEPTTFALAGLGALAIGMLRRRSSSQG